MHLNPEIKAAKTHSAAKTKRGNIISTIAQVAQAKGCLGSLEVYRDMKLHLLSSHVCRLNSHRSEANQPEPRTPLDLQCTCTEKMPR